MNGTHDRMVSIHHDLIIILPKNLDPESDSRMVGEDPEFKQQTWGICFRGPENGRQVVIVS